MRSAFGKAVYTAGPAFLPHCESHETARVKALIKLQHTCGVIVIIGGDNYFGNVCPEGETLLCQCFKSLKGVGSGEIVIGADEDRAAFPGLPADALGHHCRGLYFEVGVCRSGVDGGYEQGLGFLGCPGVELAVVSVPVVEGGPDFGHPAGGYEGHVGGGEQLFHLVLGQVAPVKPDFSHLHLPGFEDGEDFVKRPVLY